MFLQSHFQKNTLRPYWLFLVLSLFALAAIIIYSKEPQIDYDSKDFVSASKSLSIYLFGQNPDGHTYLYRPPVLILFLHFFLNKLLAAKWLNAVCFIASLWLCFFISCELQFKKLFQILALIIIGFSLPWLQNHFFVWTEPLFSTILLALVIALMKNKSFLWISFLCILLFFTRKAGVFVMCGVFIYYLLNNHQRDALRFAVSSFCIVVAWEVFTFLLAQESPSQNIFLDLWNEPRSYYLQAFIGWFWPSSKNSFINASFLIFISSAFAFLYRAFNRLKNSEQLKPIQILVIVYFTIVVLFLGAADYGDSERYLSVMLPLVMLWVVNTFQSIYLSQDGSRRIFFLAGILAWMIYPISRTIYHLL